MKIHRNETTKIVDDANIRRICNKRNIYGFMKLIVFLLILSICLSIVNNITKRKYAYEKNKDFSSQKENFDVLFFGSSHMLNAVFPMQLWKEQGIISYNLGNHSEYVPVSYYNILLACKQTKPKLIVVDTFLIHGNEKHSKNTETIHNMFDIYPISYTKYLAVNDIFSDENTLDRKVEYLLNFSMYHTRWNSIKQEDFKDNKIYEKGADSRIAVAEPNRFSDFDSINSYYGKETVGMEYLRKIIKYCQENNIELLVTNLPYPAADNMIAFSKYTEKICDEYNVNYINFLGEDVINYNVDCYDKSDHLNPSGARKVTEYLGKYIMENYNIPDQRKNEEYSFWNEDYNKYIDMKITNLKNNEKNLNNYIMLLYGEKDINYEIKISSKIKIEENATLQELLKNINNNYEINDEEFKEKQDKTIKIITWDKRSGKKIATVWF